MLSKSGRSYDRTRVSSPFKTKQRFRYYQLQPVKSIKKMPKLYQTLDTNLREKHDSFSLRYSKETIINTNHHPNYQFVQEKSRSQKFDKSPVQRYIGDINDEDFSIPLNKGCNHRCAKANNVSFPKEQQQNHDNIDNSQITQSITVTNASQPLKQKAITRKLQVKQFQPLHLSGKLQKSDLKSTEPSLIKKRSQSILNSLQKSFKQQRLRGVSFDSSIGHQYLKEVQQRLKKQKVPQFYDICDAKESIIRKSMKEPRIYIKFDKFRDVIAHRKDRADPVWFNELDSSNQTIQPKDLSYNFDMYSPRQRMAVQSKYPYRQNMNFYIFPIKENAI